ncbi:MAG TPA: cytochrome c oxidase subunit II [Vicinamibacterales bacterium]
MGRRLLLLVLVTLTAACNGVQTPLDPAGPQAGVMASVTWWFFGVCAVVYLLVIAATIWALVRRRRPEDDAPEAARRLGWIVAGAAAVTVVTAVALSTVSVVAGRGLLSPSGPGAITVDVIGHQWWWEFQYHDMPASGWVSSPNELHIPVGVPVVIKATSRDVIHSFWVPNLSGKRDLVPGMTTHTWIQADVPGGYRGQCAEFCGHQHANMAFLVVAEPMEQFQRWLEEQRRPAPPPQTAVQQRGHDLFLGGTCVMCHTVRGTTAGSRVGPDLTHVASRRTIAAGTLPFTRDHLAGWIANPQSVKPGNRMPPTVLKDDDLQALVSYLETLR